MTDESSPIEPERVYKFNKTEILLKLINCVMGAGLVFIGAFADGHVSKTSILAAGIIGVAFLFKEFASYWSEEWNEYKGKSKSNLIGNML